MDMRRFGLSALLVCMAITETGPVCGQEFPNKSIRIVTAEPGAGLDFVARLIGQGLTGHWGHQAIIDNRGAANGTVAAQTVAKAPADGYTLLFYSSVFWILPFMQSVPYDPVKDFLPITLATTSPLLLVVTAALPVNSVRDLVALSKARPGELNYATAAAGSTPHLAAELFKSMAGVNVVRVAYKGTAPALTDLISGQVQLMFATAASVAPHLKSGRLRALAHTGAQPSALAPGIATIAASGLPGYEAETAYGMFAPGRTSLAVVNQLNAETVKILNTPSVKERIFNSGLAAIGNSREEFSEAIKAEMAKMGKLIRDVGIKVD